MPTIIDGSGSADFQTPLPLGEGGTGSVVGALSGPNGSAFALRNRIINGDMRIDQRNNGAAVTVSGSFPYLLDRWLSTNNTGGGTLTAQQSTLGNARSFLLTATSAVTNLTGTSEVRGLQQGIEAQNVFDLNSKSVTISFQVSTNWTGNLGISLFRGSIAFSYVTNAPVVSGINTVSVTIPLESSTVTASNNSAGLYLIIGACNEGTYRTATTNAWVANGIITSTSSTQWTKTAGNFINVTNVQLEEGSVATPFERRPIGLELALRQRYFQTVPRLFGLAISATTMQLNTQFGTPMRATPTVTTTNTNVSGESPVNVTGRTASGGSASLGFFDNLGGSLNMSGFSGMAGQATATINPFCSFSAEL